jgi:hypothetical protein
MGIRSRTGEELRADLQAVAAEDDELAAAEATIARIRKRRAVRQRALEAEARADALAAVAGQSARAQALRPLRTYPMPGLPGASLADLLFGELAAGKPVTSMGQAVRSLIPGDRVTRESVVSALRTACIDPTTGNLEALR